VCEVSYEVYLVLVLMLCAAAMYEVCLMLMLSLMLSAETAELLEE